MNKVQIFECYIMFDDSNCWYQKGIFIGMKRPLLVVTMSLVIAAWLHLLAGGFQHPSEFAPKEGSVVSVQAQICEKEEQKIWVKAVRYNENGYEQIKDFPYKMVCRISGNTDELKMGQKVVLTGTFQSFSKATNPGEFDQEEYYLSMGAGGEIKDCTIRAVSRKYNIITENTYRLKKYLKQRIYHNFLKEEASVMAALLLGEKSELDPELKNLYKRNGILHILSISSLHITLIGMSLYRLLRKMGFGILPAAFASGLILLLYGTMVGFSISATRAIGMFLLRMLAEVCGRTYDMLTALGVMAYLMILANPYRLLNSGFLLSFLAVLGVGVVYPCLYHRREYRAKEPKVLQEQKKKKKREQEQRPQEQEQRPQEQEGQEQQEQQEQEQRKPLSGRTVSGWKLIEKKFTQEMERGKVQQRFWELGERFRESLWLNLSITVTTLPVQLYFFYEYPVASLFINLFVLPFMKPMLAFGFLGLLPGLGFFAKINQFILMGYEFLCSIFDHTPFRSWNSGCPEAWKIGVYYFFLGVILWFEKKGIREKIEVADSRKKSKKESDKYLQWKMLTLFIFNILVLSIDFEWFDRTNQLIALDIGQGDCILMQLTTGENYLVDCGSSSRNKVGQYVLLPCLKYYGIKKLDGVVVSHPDKDHMNGVVELLTLAQENQIRIERLFLPAVTEEQKEEFLEIYKGAGMAGLNADQIHHIKAGDSWSVFTCLNPVNGIQYTNSNTFSICLYVDLGNTSILFTGDVEGEGEDALLEELKERDIQNVTLLKCAHHGSKYSTSEELLYQVSPLAVLISSGKKNRYGHPHQETLTRLEKVGARILRTDEAGAVQVLFSDKSVTILERRYE